MTTDAQTSASFRYVILGAGRQGTAAAYDLILRGGASEVILADRDLAIAEASAARVNTMTGTSAAAGRAIEVTDHDALRDLLAPADVALSAVPYYFNVAIARAAIAAGTSLVDMGGHTGIVREQLALDAEARAAGVVILPDCGMGPGLINVLAVHAMDQLDEPREVLIADAGLPQDPEPPWNYLCAFHINGLTNEYDGIVPLLRGGEIVEIEALSEPKLMETPRLGELETFIAAGGSTAPWSFQGLLERFETRICRYPGHFDWFRGFRELGLFREDPIEVNGQRVVPREVYHALLAPHISAAVVRDICVMRCIATGTLQGAEAKVVLDLVDEFDEATGMPGMERLTGWHCAMMMAFIARGEIPAGARALEARLLDATPTAAAVLDQCVARGFQIDLQVT